jgi:hypothetical protein
MTCVTYIEICGAYPLKVDLNEEVGIEYKENHDKHVK